MKVLIIEDEKAAAQKLKRLLKSIDTKIEVLETLNSVLDAKNWFLTQDAPDLIFMDIQLEDGICFEIFEQIEIQTPIIFTTAFDDYTLKAFKLNSIDYLLKPIDADELKQAIEKYRSLNQNTFDVQKIEHVLAQFQQQSKERFLIKIGERYKSIPCKSIHCFYISERHNFILHETGKIYPIDYSLDKIEQMVDSKLFYRINRHTLVNFHAIQDIQVYSTHRLKLNIEQWTESNDLLVSRERVSDFKQWMDR